MRFDIGLSSVRKFGSPYVPPRILSFNPAERTVIATITSDGCMSQLDCWLGVEPGARTEKLKIQIQMGMARNWFAVLNK
jgi:coatomer subunit alpha